MMLARIIFCTAVSLAVLTVVLLGIFSPAAHRKPSRHHHTKPWLDLSLYIQQPLIPAHYRRPALQSDSGALIFRRTLTKGPENTSMIVGQAQGFILPVKNFEHSAFNIIYLTFDTPEHSGSLSIQAKHVGNKDGQELTVLGGTGSFAFARGLAAFAGTGQQLPDAGASCYHIKLQLRFPNSRI